MSANDLTNILPKILARSLSVLRERCMMPQLVNLDYSDEAAEKGDTIDVPVSTAVATRDVAPAEVPPAVVGATPTKVQISLNNWRQSDPFALTDNDLLKVDKDSAFLPMQVGEAVRGLANYINSTVHAEYKGIYGFTGTAGATPFASAVTDATNARKILNQQLCPLNNRRAVINFDCEANMLALSAFSSLQEIGESGPRIEGQIGRKYGIDWYADDAVVTHTAGSGSAYVTNGTQALGATSIVLQTGSGTVLVGDIVTFAGHSQTYVVTTGIAAPGTIVINPPLKVAVTTGVLMTSKASHVVNIAMHREAFALAMRPVLDSTAGLPMGGTMDVATFTDPISGLSLRLERKREHKQTAWEFDALWGTKLVRPALATRIAG